MKNNSITLENISEKLLNECDTIFILSHNNPDLDAVGASIGCAMIGKKYKKNVYLVIGDDIINIESSTKHAIEDITSEERKKDGTYLCVIKPDQIETFKGNNNLLVIVDASKKSLLCVDPENKIFNNIVIIDHHAKDETSINIGYKYINPKKSSTCEIIVKLFNSFNIKINEAYANYMLAGIYVDTDRLKKNISEDTLDSMKKLIKYGADIGEVVKLFKEDFEKDKMRQKMIVDNSQISSFDYNIGICCNMDDDNKIYFRRDDIAKIATSFLERYRVNASFAVGYLTDDIVFVSARSDGTINIGNIMKKFGGGGHIYSAAAFILNSSLKEVVCKLKEEFRPDFFVKEEEKEKDRTKKLELTI